MSVHFLLNNLFYYNYNRSNIYQFFFLVDENVLSHVNSLTQSRFEEKMNTIYQIVNMSGYIITFMKMITTKNY